MCAIRRYEDIENQDCWPLSRLYHTNSSINSHSIRDFGEHIQQFSNDMLAVKASAESRKEYPAATQVSLPKPRRWWGKKLSSVMETRRTRRGQFSGRPLSLRETGRFLYYSAGITGSVQHPKYAAITQKLRSWASGGAMYPLEIYWGILAESAIPKGFYHYAPYKHSLEYVTDMPEIGDLQKCYFADGLWEGVAVLIVITAIWSRTQIKYGERGYRFVLLDAGHLGQNMLLVAEDMNLNIIPLGGFDDQQSASMLSVNPENENAVYALLLGKRK